MKKVVMFMLIAALACMLVGQVNAADEKIKIGLSFSDFSTDRWPMEAELMKKLIEEAGAEAIIQVSNQDAKLQNDQIENMVLQGVNVLIVIPLDGAAAAVAVDNASKQGVKVIAYDRLIKSANLSAYLSFDNVAVGRAQGEGVLKRVSKGKFALLGGSPTDNNALLFRKGQMEALQPYIDKGDVTIVADQWVENWDPANATKVMENILAAQSNVIDAVVASNDGTALGALQALNAQGLAGKVAISGQDATTAGCQSIVNDELTLTVFKDIRLLSPMAIDMALKLAKGEAVEGLQNFSLAELTGDDKVSGNVPCKFLEVVQVTKDNIYDVIVKSGFQSYDDVYKNVPEDKRPPKP